MHHRSILITGGTGSFGHAFVERLLVQGHYDRIAVLSRSEHLQASMAERFAHDRRLRFFVGDVRDPSRLRRAFGSVDVVVHAAALKRIEVGHYNPSEMVKTNVLGAMNVIEAAQDAGVKKVIALSTDKAYQPVSAYGQSKALAETLFMNANNQVPANGPKFVVLRYGNVAGSAGSVIPKWRELLKETGRLPVTDPDCTRFWMFMDEAVDLVQHSIARALGDEIVIPQLPAYRLGDLAFAMGAKELDIRGLPIWEKKHEGMAPGNTSDIAPRLTMTELKERLQRVA